MTSEVVDVCQGIGPEGERMSRRALRIIAETLLPAGAHPRFKLGAADTGVDAFIDELEATAVTPMRLSFWGAVVFATWAAPLMIRRLPPLGRLSLPDRERALGAMASSPVYLIRQLIMMLKMTLSFAYGADRRVQAQLGYPEQFDLDHPERRGIS